jgi:hypothetical protein
MYDVCNVCHVFGVFFSPYICLCMCSCPCRDAATASERFISCTEPKQRHSSKSKRQPVWLARRCVMCCPWLAAASLRSARSSLLLALLLAALTYALWSVADTTERRHVLISDVLGTICQAGAAKTSGSTDCSRKHRPQPFACVGFWGCAWC